VTPDATAKTSPLLLPPAAEAEVDHEVERGVQHCQQVVDADQYKNPLKEKESSFKQKVLMTISFKEWGFESLKL
jgi:hypothetical protein